MLYEYAQSHTLNELLTKTLDEVSDFTKSPVGFYHFVLPDQETLHLQAWSTRTEKEFCNAEGKGLHYKISEAGVWADSVRTKKTVVHNDYASLLNKKGMPEGHADVIREMVVPVIRNEKVVAVLGIGNKPTEYTEKDIEITNFLADLSWEIADKKNKEEALKQSEIFFKETQKIAGLGSYVLDIKNDRWESSETLDIIFGIEPEFDKSVSGWTSIIHFEWQKEIADYFATEVIGKKQKFDKEYKIVRRNDKSERWVHGLGELVFNEDNKPVQMIGTIKDITERKKAEQEILSLNRVYALLSSTNEAIVRIKDKQNLFDEICRIAIDNGKFRMAWIGIVNQANNKLDIVASSGVIESYLDEINIDLNDSIRSQGPAGKALKTGIHFISNDIENDVSMIPWKENALSLEYKSSASLPLKVFGKTIGAFTLYSNQKDFFQDQEIRLIDEMAMDISFNLEFKETESIRMKSEEALIASEKKFKEMADLLPQVIFETDDKGVITYVNEMAYKLFQYTQEDISNKLTAFQIFTPEERPKVAENLNRVLKGEKTTSHEYMALKKYGTPLNVLIFSAPIITDGNVTGIRGTITDITEQKKAEEVLRESEERLSTIFNTSIEGICSADKNENITFVNPRFAKMSGYTVEELEAMNFMQLVPADEIENHIARISLRQKGGSEMYERSLLRKDGSVLLTLASATAIKDKKSGYTGSFGMFTDITEQKLAEDEIRKLSRGIEQSPASVVITDLNGNIEYVNSKFCEVSGYNYEEMIGKNPRILQSGEKTKEDYAGMWNTILSGKDWKGEFHNRKKNGELYWESASISPIINEQGEITHFIGIKEDITEQKKMINDLIVSKDKAEEMNRLKSNFLANMSHELRTPLVGILGYSDFLRNDIQSKEFKDMADTIFKSGQRLSETLNLILDLSQLETERKEIKYQQIDLVSITNEITDLFKEIGRKKGLYLKVITNQDSIIINSDRRALYSILNNLINNAVKFTAEGGITTSISLTNNTAEIKVTDTGIGIDKKNYGIIFEEFRQVSEGFSRNFEGSGLGLSITKKFVEKLSGNISITSKVGVGSTFTVLLPLSVNAEEVKPLTPVKVLQAENFPEKISIKLKAIVVDDDPLVFPILNRYINDYVELEHFADAEFALKKLKKKKYDLIFMDMNLKRGIDGMQATQKIRTLPGYKTIPIVAITAYAMKGDREEFLESGCSHYLSKPFKINDVREVLRKIVTQN